MVIGPDGPRPPGTQLIFIVDPAANMVLDEPL